MTDPTAHALLQQLTDALDRLDKYRDINTRAFLDSGVSHARIAARDYLSQTTPKVELTDEDLDGLEDTYYWFDANHSKPWRPFARAVLEDYAHKASLPIPLSERMPNAEDCDEQGCCWWYRPRALPTSPGGS